MPKSAPSNCSSHLPSGIAYAWANLKAALIGAQPTSPLGKHRTIPASVVPEIQCDPNLRGEVRRGPRPRTQLVYDALAEAAADFEYNEVRPLRELVPGTVFRLEQIRTQCGPDAMALLVDVINLRRAHRNKAVVSKIGSLGFDMGSFADWRIEELTGERSLLDTAPEGDTLTVLAGDGPYRAKLNFQFYGTFDEVESDSLTHDVNPSWSDAASTSEACHITPQPVVHRIEQSQPILSEEGPALGKVLPPFPAVFASETLVASPPSPGQHTSTLLDAGVASPEVCNVLARLRLTTEDGHEQLIDITSLPFEIGREPNMRAACVVPEAAARVSRAHLRLEKMQAGAFIVSNLGFDRSGTWCNGEKLDRRFILTPVRVQSKGGWHILGERNLSATSVALRLELAA